MPRRNPLSLAPIESALITFAAALCRGDEELIREAVNRSLDAGATNIELREIIHTSYLFDGYPTALEGFRILTDMTGRSEADPQQFLYNPANITLWHERGRRLCKLIYGPQFEPLMAKVADIAPELADAMIVEGYGKVLSGPHMTPALRELCVVAMLSVKDKPRQLLSHSLGALRLGAGVDKLNGVPTALETISKSEIIEKSRKVIEVAVSKYDAP